MNKRVILKFIPLIAVGPALILCKGLKKEAGTSHWTSPNKGSTNDSGFATLPAGYRQPMYDPSCPSFFNLSIRCTWWSATVEFDYGIFYEIFYNQSILEKYS
jgi:hypothetical protein